MAIKKRATCMQKVSLGGTVFRCSECGHMSVIQDKEAQKCPLCNGSMISVSENQASDSPEKKQADPSVV